MNHVSFLRPPVARPSLDVTLERPITELDVYRIWWRAGIIQRASRKPGIIPSEIFGPFCMGIAVGFCLSYLAYFKP